MPTLRQVAPCTCGCSPLLSSLLGSLQNETIMCVLRSRGQGHVTTAWVLNTRQPRGDPRALTRPPVTLRRDGWQSASAVLSGERQLERRSSKNRDEEGGGFRSSWRDERAGCEPRGRRAPWRGEGGSLPAHESTCRQGGSPLPGIVGCGCCVLWFTVIYEDPVRHLCISVREKEHIMPSLAQQVQGAPSPCGLGKGRSGWGLEMPSAKAGAPADQIFPCSPLLPNGLSP